MLRSLASGSYILGSLAAESADGFSDVLDANGQGRFSGTAIGRVPVVVPTRKNSHKSDSSWPP